MKALNEGLYPWPQKTLDELKARAEKAEALLLSVSAAWRTSAECIDQHAWTNVLADIRSSTSAHPKEDA